ncbi:phosphate ABC transporter, permease protein PstA [Neorickettsia helminthoeca str. Oregon]|uniref:Phosphate transport system permease protein PstA n=1 Tax=Neorickettsia helminthoeca str. Oregon TaxID=1286528 RepID=X5GWG3_9RICK|nr:phosphate ABC transporter permease PstA [Neorickettsia helminthoeca]AHX11397.1 phosphate ABC transporter, permease protein PstA [Neorickettsia helminthoeca str. Oregon]
MNINYLRLKLTKRGFVNKIFSLFCILCAFVPVFLLFTMLFSIFSGAYNGLQQTKFFIDLDEIGITTKDSRYQIREKLIKYLKIQIPWETDIFTLMNFLSNYSTHEVMDAIHKEQKKIWITISGEGDVLHKYKGTSNPEMRRILKYFDERALLKKTFNYKLFTNPDSRDSSQTGIMGALVGSLYTIFVSLLVSFPVGVLTALWIGEYLGKGNITRILEVSVNNLSSTPPIIFGVLGLSFYINFLGLPRSSPLVGGLTLAFMMFPILVISSLHAIRSVPDTIKQAAFALGASKVQVILHHVLPLSVPGIMTGTVLGIARIIGESAPLLMIGMVAFVGNIPSKITEPANVFAVQIYIWATSSDIAMTEKTSVIILILLLLLFLLNCVVYLIRKIFHYDFY